MLLTMRGFFAVAFLLILLASEAFSSPREVGIGETRKRDLIDFGTMVYCATGRNPIDFNDYGCYCGFGGKGTPVDALDKCCKEHDDCYGRVTAANNNCGFDLMTYTAPYYTKSCLECEPASYYWILGECRSTLCECDRTAALCFGASKYIDENKNLDYATC